MILLDDPRPDAVVHALVRRRTANALEVLLLLRARTGRADGTWAMPAGRIERGESVRAAVIRELREETGIEADPDRLEIVTVAFDVLHGDRREHVVVRVDAWRGEPSNREPDSCDDLRWCHVEHLPEPMVPFVRDAIF